MLMTFAPPVVSPPAAAIAASDNDAERTTLASFGAASHFFHLQRRKITPNRTPTPIARASAVRGRARTDSGKIVRHVSHDLSGLPTPLADVRNNGVHAVLYLPDLRLHLTERIVAGYGQGAADILCETHDVRTQALQVVADLADRRGLCPFLPG
jgi:hypothetical protein